MDVAKTFKRIRYAFILLTLISQRTSCELFSSTEQLSSWPVVSRQLLGAIDEYIRLEEETLQRLRITIKLFKGFTTRLLHDNLERVEDETITNPVIAFANLNRIIDSLDEFRYRMDKDILRAKERIQQADDQYNELKAIIPIGDDLVGIGEAIIRLQKFYRLNTSDLAIGRLVSGQDPNKSLGQVIKLTAKECFQIGKIAYDNDDYTTSVEWFQKSLDLIPEEQSAKQEYYSEDEFATFTNDVLDHLAFAAYKIKHFKYAAEVTKLWLDRDPENERARENLDYYIELLEDQESYQAEELAMEGDNDGVKKNMAIIYQSGATLDAGSYVLTEDDVIRDLCIGSQVTNDDSYCYVMNTFAQDPLIPNLKFEILNNSPRIIRIHDIITDREAEQLRQIALSKLERSTVQSSRGLVASDFRIAKTAWIASTNNSLVGRVEDRMRIATGLRLENSEDLQLVNYGLGGYYGPHLDSARKSRSSHDRSMESEEEQVEVASLRKSDRLATILIYLNHIDAGGATVFPRLNLTVEPIKNSAIIWYNLSPDGFSDERTLHSGCPVLLGTKWIATKWPREDPNIFVRPCELKG